ARERWMRRRWSSGSPDDTARASIAQLDRESTRFPRAGAEAEPLASFLLRLPLAHLVVADAALFPAALLVGHGRAAAEGGGEQRQGGEDRRDQLPRHLEPPVAAGWRPRRDAARASSPQVVFGVSHHSCLDSRR